MENDKIKECLKLAEKLGTTFNSEAIRIKLSNIARCDLGFLVSEDYLDSKTMKLTLKGREFLNK